MFFGNNSASAETTAKTGEERILDGDMEMVNNGARGGYSEQIDEEDEGLPVSCSPSDKSY